MALYVLHNSSNPHRSEANEIFGFRQQNFSVVQSKWYLPIDWLRAARRREKWSLFEYVCRLNFIFIALTYNVWPSIAIVAGFFFSRIDTTEAHSKKVEGMRQRKKGKEK